ncbi:hypothetical protein Mmc1_0777 [Magnetococcus marinus MC-1]|uniref:Uncharacterized protein n=1 Tax=Magnetococcus marinus (strain ATCC BAA-1437 / JCM 17883 / MC-1) TaxID=156889 RepID=A0L5Q5_MAGMM|nr:hypothetical protein [Magnetococcus marinus]ABK43298.1 hypothetical protein Mmc1_0777 [Magnetococcus marinus MC-1]
MEICHNEQKAIVSFKLELIRIMQEHQSDRDAFIALASVFDAIPKLTSDNQTVTRCDPCTGENCSYRAHLLMLAERLSQIHGVDEALQLFKEHSPYQEQQRVSRFK